MGPFTVVTFLAILVFTNHLRAYFRLVCSKRPPSILVKVMVEWAALEVMILRVLLTLIYFESEEVQEHDALTHTYLSSVKSTAMRHLVDRLVIAVAGPRPIIHIEMRLLRLRWKLFINRYLLLELILTVLGSSCLIRLVLCSEAGLRALKGTRLVGGCLIQLLVLGNGI